MLERIADTIITGELDADGWKLTGEKPYVVRYGRRHAHPEIPGGTITPPTHLWSSGVLVPLSDAVRPPRPTKASEPTPTPQSEAEALLGALVA